MVTDQEEEINKLEIVGKSGFYPMKLVHGITVYDNKRVSISAKDNDRITFTPPDTLTDWVLLIRKKLNP